MSKRVNRVGQEHGVFKVVELVESDGDQTFWKCICTSCGSTVVRQNRYFRKDRGTPKGCMNCKGSNHWLYKGYEGLNGTYLKRIRDQAKERGHEYLVDPKYLWELYLSQNKKCYITGLDICFGEEQTASLDRIDSSIGYLKGNLAWCHKDINWMKGKFDLEYFTYMCSLVAREPKVPELNND